MRITWPEVAPPSKVEIRREGQPARQLTPRRKNGRPYVEEKVHGLAVGESVEIGWTW
jgi:hypothetical protein